MLRIEKVLEDANLKLGVVLSDIMGKSGRAVLQAIVDGQTTLNTCCRHRPRQGQPRRTARSPARAHQRAPPLHAQAAPEPHRSLDQAIATIEKEVGLGLEPFRQAAKLLSTMPA